MLGFVNTELFSLEAKHFLKYGRYCDDPIDSPAYLDYWTHQEMLCQNGYSVGGVKITGDHYYYLNFARMMATEETSGELIKTKSRIKREAFPDFWDGDYQYFWLTDIARKGISEDEYKKLGLDINVQHLTGGKHLLVLKTRRRGYSYKNGAKATKIFTFERKKKVYINAYEKELYKPLITMVANQLNFLNEHTGFKRTRDFIDRMSLDNFHVEAAYKITDSKGNPIKKGRQSSIQAMTFKDKPDAGRGKDAELVLWEEAGSFDNLKTAWQIQAPSLEDGDYVTGQMIGFGTGGDFAGGQDFIEMFYNPDPYNILSIDNKWDEGMQGTTCSLFIPDYLNKKGFIDKDGNSDTEGAKLREELKREHIKKTAKDPTAIDRYIAEYPFCPKEATLEIGTNIFPKAELITWQKTIQTSVGLSNIGTTGQLYYDAEGVLDFKPTQDVKPILHFPIKKDVDGEGCVIRYQPPYKADGTVPANLYYIAHDPYSTDNQNGMSLGAAYVLKRINNFSKPDDLIVAEYVARPATQDEYNRNLFMLAEYYNAKICFENDTGNVVDYAKRTKRLHLLVEEFDLQDGNTQVVRKLNRSYGVSMNSLRRKEQAAIYLRDWLTERREIDIEGKILLNLHKIYSVPLLEEIIKFNYKGNFDRVSCLLVAMLYDKYLFDIPAQPKERYIYDDDFFKRLGGYRPDVGNY